MKGIEIVCAPFERVIPSFNSSWSRSFADKKMCENSKETEPHLNISYLIVSQ